MKVRCTFIGKRSQMPRRDFPAREGSESNAPVREASRGDPLLTAKETARFMRVSEFLARQGADAGRRPDIRADRSCN